MMLGKLILLSSLLLANLSIIKEILSALDVKWLLSADELPQALSLVTNS